MFGLFFEYKKQSGHAIKLRHYKKTLILLTAGNDLNWETEWFWLNIELGPNLLAWDIHLGNVRAGIDIYPNNFKEQNNG